MRKARIVTDKTFPVIVCELTGDDIAQAHGIRVRVSSPVLALCRKLVEAGYDPDSPLEAYRGDTLCLRIRSIGEAARLRVGGDGRSFMPAEADIAPPMRWPVSDGLSIALTSTNAS
jgi:hypothetical protein